MKNEGRQRLSMMVGDPDRRRFVGACGLGCLALFAPPRSTAAMFATSSAAAELTASTAVSGAVPRTQLIGGDGEPFRAADMQIGETYVFAYPVFATPAFVVRLGGAAQEGVGPDNCIVAYSAVCTHRLAHPTRQLSYIAYRPARDERDPALGLIGCCAENSRYDPADAGRVLSGPAPSALGRVRLEHDPATDTLHAVEVSDPELLQRFLDTFALRLTLEHPNGDFARQVGSTSVVLPLASYSERVMGC